MNVLALRRGIIPSVTRWLPAVTLGTVVLAGAVIRLDRLDARGIGHIEIYVPNIALPDELSQPPPRLSLLKTITGAIWEVHPPAWYIAMWPWTRLFGTSLLAVRLPSVLLGAASILLIAVLAKLEENRTTALLAASLLAFNGYHILWSQIARPATVACFLGLLSTTLLLLVARGGRWQRAWLILYSITTLIGLATLYYFWPIFAIHILWVFLTAWSRRPMTLGLLRSQFLILVLASPLVTLVIFQSRASYLSSNTLAFMSNYLQFGFLFEADIDGPALPSTAVRLALMAVAILLIILGFFAKKPKAEDQAIYYVRGPSFSILAFAAALASLSMILFADVALDKVLQQTDPLSRSIATRSNVLFASSVTPIAVLLLAVLIHRYSSKLQGFGEFLSKMEILSGGPYSLISLLAILPIIIVAGVNQFVPFLAPRHMLLFTPYLFIGIARGGASLIRHPRRWFSFALFLGISGFLAALHILSIHYHKQRPISPTDYQGLAEQWKPHIKEPDLILVQRHWVTTPIFYYLPGDQFSFVGGNYTQELTSNPQSRVWVLSFEGLPDPDEVADSLENYELSMSIEARRIKAELYSK